MIPSIVLEEYGKNYSNIQKILLKLINPFKIKHIRTYTTLKYKN